MAAQKGASDVLKSTEPGEGKACDRGGALSQARREACFARARWRAFGQHIAQCLVPLGLLVLLAHLAPGVVPPWAERLGEAGWASGAFGLMIALAMGSLSARTLRRLNAEARAPRSSPDEPS